MIFIDTGAFLAKYLSHDQYHARAKKIWKKLQRKDCVTSHHVIDETLTLLARRSTYAFAAERASAIYQSQHLKILRSTEADEKRAIDFFKKFSDQAVSFTDAISFALMEKYQISRAFSFDRHFALLKIKILS